MLFMWNSKDSNNSMKYLFTKMLTKRTVSLCFAIKSKKYITNMLYFDFIMKITNRNSKDQGLPLPNYPFRVRFRETL